MKTAKSLFIILLLCIIVLACVPTPDKDYISQKDMSKMIEQAKQTPASVTVRDENTPSGSSSDATTSESAQTKEQVQFSFTGKTTGQFRVVVDAVVTRPNVPMPIIRVLSSDFDEKTANRFFAVLTKGFDLYTQDQLETAPVLDKKIQEAMDEIANGNDEEPMKDYLNELIEKRKNASDMIGEPVMRIDLQTKSNVISINEKQIFRVISNATYSNGQVGKCATLFFINYEALNDHSIMTDYRWREMQFVKGLQTIPKGYTKTDMTPKDAEITVEKLLAELDLKDFQVSDLLLMQLDNGDYAYVALCDRYWNDIQVVCPAESSGGYEGSTSPEWGYERVIIELNEKGLAYFLYFSPLQVEDVVVDGSNILPFDQIMELFKQAMCMKYEVEVIDPGFTTNALEYHITDITLTLQRITEQDNIDYGLLVPVYNFWGYAVRTSSYDDQAYESRHSTNWKGLEPILSINAINGTIINPIEGY